MNCKITILILSTLILVNCQLPDNFIKGICFSTNNGSDIAYNQTQSLIVKSQQLGANWISLAIRLYMPNISANTITSYKETSTDDEINIFLNTADRIGLKVMFKILVHPENDIQMNINPSDPDQWFQSYEKWNVHYAKLVSQHPSVQIYCIGVELGAISIQYTDKWKHLIATLRQEFSGQLTYGALLTDWKYIEFWQDLDLIGLDAYWNSTTTDNLQPSLQHIIAVWNHYFTYITSVFQQKNLTNKPIIIAEIGYPSNPVCLAEPWSISPDENCDGIWIKDYDCQSLAYQGLLEAIRQNQNIIKGLFMYQMDLPGSYDVYPSGDEYECGYTFQGKPSESVLAFYYNGTNSYSAEQLQ